MDIDEILYIAGDEDLPYVRQEPDVHQAIRDLRIRTKPMTPDQQARNQLLLDLMIRNLKK